MTDQHLRLYEELAVWWPLMSPPSHYVEEAEDLLPTLLASARAPRTLLELGSGGGSLACHLKGHFRLTLTDRSPQMLAVNQGVNPECEHVLGDMRTLDLGRHFDLVLIHDAIMYATEPASLQATLATAARHCRLGGTTVIFPDCVKETFEPGTDHGGEDGADGRAMRYMEWSWDPDRCDDTFETLYAFALREPDGSTHVERDLHRNGVFARAAWFDWLRLAGFPATSRTDCWNRDVFIAQRR